MKVLLVSGEDYAALTFEQDLKGDVKGMWEKAVELPNCTYTDENTGIEFTAYEFAEVDPRFVTFIDSEIIDYDDAKSTNYYVVEDDTEITS